MLPSSYPEGSGLVGCFVSWRMKITEIISFFLSCTAKLRKTWSIKLDNLKYCEQD